MVPHPDKSVKMPFSFLSPKFDTDTFDTDIPMRHIDGSVRTYAEYKAEQETRDEMIRRAYNLQKIEMSPVAVSQFEKTADTTGDFGEHITTSTVADLFKLVKKHD